MQRFIGLGLMAFLTALAPVGCGGPAGTPESNKAEMDKLAINDVGELYRVYQVANKKPPQTLAELATGEQVAPTGLQAIRSGDVIVRLGATLPDTNEEAGGSSSSEVLAWQKQVPDQGGLVLLLDRTVKEMTSAEFQSATKAGTKDSTGDTSEKKKKK